MVGTDLLFGLVLALLGGGVHLAFGQVAPSLLLALASGGVAGGLLGALFATRLPKEPLRLALLLWLLFIGGQLVYRGWSMGRVYLVGAGPGDPELLTLKAYRLLKEAPVVLYDRLVDERVLALAPGEKVYVGKEEGKAKSRRKSTASSSATPGPTPSWSASKGATPWSSAGAGRRCSSSSGTASPWRSSPG